MDIPLDGPVRIKDLRARGISRRRLDDAIAAGTLARPFREVVTPADWAESPAQRAASLSLVLPRHVVVCDRTAAWIHGVDCLDPDASPAIMPIEVVSQRIHSPTRRPGVYGGERDLLPHEVIDVGGVRVTTPRRTAMDVACLRGPFMSLAVLEAFMREHRITREDYLRALPRFRGRRGVVQLRRSVGHASLGSESFGESFTKAAFIDAGIPVPEQQVWVDVPSWGPVRLDFADRSRLAYAEFDGRENHGEAQAEHDNARRDALAGIGWDGVVVVKEDLSAERRANWIADYEAIRRARTPDPKRTFPRGEPRQL